MDFFTQKLTRREFLKLIGLGAVAAALPNGLVKAALSDFSEGSWARITRYRLYVFAEPSEKSKVQDLLKFDQLVRIEDALTVKDSKGKEHPWLKIGEEAYIQPVFVQYVETHRNVSNDPRSRPSDATPTSAPAARDATGASRIPCSSSIPAVWSVTFRTAAS